MSFRGGDLIPFQTRAPITREQLKAYASASGDTNEIHLDEEVAKANGLPGIIAHGMLTAAFIAERAREFCAGDGIWITHSVQNRFKAMTFPGDVISVGGSVKQVSEAELTLELQAKNQRGELTTTGLVKFKRA